VVERRSLMSFEIELGNEFDKLNIKFEDLEG
jgi:hypothetical protein